MYSEKRHLGHARYQLHGKGRFVEMFSDDRLARLLDETPDRIPNVTFLNGQQVVEQIIVTEAVFSIQHPLIELSASGIRYADSEPIGSIRGRIRRKRY